MSPTISVAPTHESLSRQAADRILDALQAKPELLLCAPGGSTPSRTYELLAAEHERNPRLFGSLRVLKLDEWGGLALDDPATCETQLQTQLIRPLGLGPDRYFGFNSAPADPQEECRRIRQVLASRGPIDFCVLGLGMNGHIGMNEPAPSLEPCPHVAQLTESSLGHSMLAKCRTRPSYGLTLGMSDILGSREILLLVSGAGKRVPLQVLLSAKISTQFPASFLWLHPHCTVLCEGAAAEGLELPHDQH